MSHTMDKVVEDAEKLKPELSVQGMSELYLKFGQEWNKTNLNVPNERAQIMLNKVKEVLGSGLEGSMLWMAFASQIDRIQGEMEKNMRCLMEDMASLRVLS